jgi:DNA polymerase-3 subunit delta'
MSFNEVVGQKEVKELLGRSLLKQRIASSYLFCGPEGVGKAMTAIIFSKAMNCKFHDTDACSTSQGIEKCPSCRKIDNFSHPDISITFPVPKKIRDEKTQLALLKEGKMHEYQKTEIIAIDDIRGIEEMLFLKPFEARRRVVLVVDAEAMNQQAQNAFLKLLEEPPRDTTIILTSSYPERLFSTIRSRCQKIQFRRLSRDEMKEYLGKRFDLSAEEMELVALLSNGSIRKAEVLLDEDKREERMLLKELVVDRDFEKLEEIGNREVLHRFIEFLIPLMRDMETAAAGSKIINVDMESYVRSEGKNYTLDEIRERIHLLARLLGGLARNVNPRIMANVVYNSIKDG